MSSTFKDNVNYRPEIDGLRAIAVISVILYHAKITVSGNLLFAGGYVGVDVFFVISGYLISRIILNENNNNSFSLSNFYERRARRILPMLLFIIFIFSFFAWNSLQPLSFVEYAQSSISSIFFGSNFFFYNVTSEYAAENSLLKPLLHTWSLSVEEQFYIVYSILLISLLKNSKKYAYIGIVLITIASLVYAEFHLSINPSLNFFNPISRFWEFLIGFFLAHREFLDKNRKISIYERFLPEIGMTFILVSVLVLMDDLTPHPGIYTILPVLGTAFIIYSNNPSSFIIKIISTRALVFTGLISYSAYLWHYPIFAFFRLRNDPNIYEIIFLITITFFLSFLTYKFVEKPFRNKKIISTKKFLILLFVAVFLLLSFSLFVIKNNGFINRSSQIISIENYQTDNKKLRKERLESFEKKNKRRFKNVPYKVLIIGNSHAEDLFNAFQENIDLIHEFDFIKAHIPEVSCLYESPNKNSSNIDSEYFDSLNKNSSNIDSFYKSPEYKDATAIVVSTAYAKRTCWNNKKILVHDFLGLKDLATRTKSDGKKLIVFSPRPEFYDLDNQIISDYVYNKYKDQDSFSSINDFDIFREESNRLLFKNIDKEIARENNKVAKSINTLNVFYGQSFPLVCSVENQYCESITPDGHKIYYDKEHWTLEGSKYFGKKLIDSDLFDILRREK